MNKQQIILGNYTPESLEHILKAASDIADPGGRIQFLSGQFLGTDYAESTLIGDSSSPEIFVVNLRLVDCMTFIEYIEALRLSASFSAFMENLKKVRYKSGVVDFSMRNHFFTDWKEFNRDFIEDVTERLGGRTTVRIFKRLNEKADGAFFLQGIQPVTREFSFIPSDEISREVIHNLRSGDYIGIFSHLQGLDVSHTGILIRQNDDVYFRHASSQTDHRGVIDQDLTEYVANKPGIVVFRPKI